MSEHRRTGLCYGNDTIQQCYRSRHGNYMNPAVSEHTLVTRMSKYCDSVVDNVSLLPQIQLRLTTVHIYMALNSLLCADVPLRNCSINHVHIYRLYLLTGFAFLVPAHLGGPGHIPEEQ